MLVQYFVNIRDHSSVPVDFKGVWLGVDSSPMEDLVSIQGYVIPKTFKMVLDTALLNTQQYKVRIKGKVEQSRECSSALPYTLVW